MWFLWTFPPSHQQSFDAVCDQLKTHVIRRVQTLTADVTGIEMSIRDQRVGTSHSDKGLRDVLSLIPLSQRTYYKPFVMKEAMSWVGWW